ncbi:hypothetical protein GGI20_003611 [Coemansia sp. BCRC 34301]|nr:hypothetical protein GGI20_003611 [Coemansia sp. BCRC 34301]
MKLSVASLFAAAALVGTTAAFAEPIQADDADYTPYAKAGNVIVVTEYVTVTAGAVPPAAASKTPNTPVAQATATAAGSTPAIASSSPPAAASPAASPPAQAALASTPAQAAPATSQALQPTAGNSGDTFTGDGTYFSPGLGSCGRTNSDTDLIAAIPAPQYGTNANPNNAEVCGKCALVKGPKGQVKVTITDRCPVCKAGDLDLSPSAFEKIGDFAAGRIPISWSFVSC